MSRIFAFCLAGLMASSAFGVETVSTFSGRDSKDQLFFSVDGDWKLVWEVDGNEEFPPVSSFSVRLYDEATGRLLGQIADMNGSGRGERYVEDDGGRYRVSVVGRDVRWKLEVVSLEPDWDSIPGFTDDVDRMQLRVLDDPQRLRRFEDGLRD